MTDPDAVEKVAPARKPSFAIAVEAEFFLMLGFLSLVTLVPKFAEVYKQIKVPVPWMTVILFTFSQFVCGHPWVVGAALVAIPYCLLRLEEKEQKYARMLIRLSALFLGLWAIVVLFSPISGGLLEGIGHRQR